MTTYAKIGVYCGIIAPMHWHVPYNYWQWPWEDHQIGKAGSDHRLHDVTNPIWVYSKCSDPTRANAVRITPTAEMKRDYAQALSPDSEIAKTTVASYKDYLRTKSETRTGTPARSSPAPFSMLRPNSDLNKLKSLYDASNKVLTTHAPIQAGLSTTSTLEGQAFLQNQPTDRSIPLINTSSHQGSALENLVEAWRATPLDSEPYFLPADEAVLFRDPRRIVLSLRDQYSVSGKDSRLHLGLLPEPYVGNLETSRIFILMLNSRVSDGWVRAHEMSSEHREGLKGNILQRGPSRFFYLQPESAPAKASRYWRDAFANLTAVLAEHTNSSKQEANAFLAANLSVLQLMPYNSRDFDLPDKLVNQLTSVRLIKAFAHGLVERARRGEVLLIVARGRRHWQIDEELSNPNIVVYRTELGEPIGAHDFSPYTKDGRPRRGGQAILNFLLQRL
jgi:hypothetical protein